MLAHCRYYQRSDYGTGPPPVTVLERPFTRHELYVADECFLTGTAAEVIPVIEVDGRQIGDGQPGAVTRDLIARFRAVVGRGNLFIG